MTILNENLVIVLGIGAIAGWLGGGLFGDIVIGVIGAFIGTWLLSQLGVYIDAGIVSTMVSATIGAVALLLAARVDQTNGRP